MASVAKACHTCGQVGHLKRDCPSGGGFAAPAAAVSAKACHICGGVGHLKRDCPQGQAAAAPAPVSKASAKTCHLCGQVSYVLFGRRVSQIRKTDALFCSLTPDWALEAGLCELH